MAPRPDPLVTAAPASDAGRPSRSLGDCPECLSAGCVREDVCEVCFAELGEGVGPAPRGASPRSEVPLRFSDVMAELAALAAPADGLADPGATAMRAGKLLRELRSQFMQDVVLAPGRRDVQVRRS